MEGMKRDVGKAPIARGFARYFPRAIIGVSMVSQFGFEKYKEWGGWRKVEDAFNRYDDAHGRHDNALQRGETHCDESKRLHLEHRAWNALATLELYLIEEEAKRGEASIEQERNDQSCDAAANEGRTAFLPCGRCQSDRECELRGYCLA